MPGVKRTLCWTLCTILVGATAIATEIPRATTEIMRDILASLRDVVPLMVSDDALDTDAGRARAREGLVAIAERADELEGHAQRFDPGRDAVRRSLSADARRALEDLDQGRDDSARFFSMRLTESCVTCHSRLPAADSLLAESFFPAADLRELAPEQRAELLISTRRFEPALEALEAILRTRSRTPAEMLDPLVDYLTVAVRVKGDFSRPIPVLAAFAKRDDLWVQLREDVEAWIEDLRRYSIEFQDEGDLESARAQMEAGRRRIRYPTDRRALIDYLAASRTLHQIIAASPEPDATLAEAYFQLGLLESRIGRSYWLAQADVYLETAVRIAPGTTVARNAFALLEEEIILGFSGSGGLHLPASERERLATLRAIAEGTTDPASGPE